MTLEEQFPFYEELRYHPDRPLDGVKNNIRWRIKICEKANHDEGFRADLMRMSADDYLFWLANFCFLFEPRGRDKKERLLPFLPWPHQERGFATMCQYWGKSDIRWEKGRGEGATWGAGMKLLHSWLFEELFAGAIASGTKALVDTKGDVAGSFMPKLDWQMAKLPPWMLPNFRRISNKEEAILQNLDRDNTITGWPATEDIGTSARVNVWIWDEMAKFRAGMDRAALAATQPTTDCRNFISTYKGTNNEYYRIMRRAGHLPLIVLRWQDNPSRNRSMFTLSSNGVPVPVNEEKYGPIPEEFMKQWPDYYDTLRLNGFDFEQEGKDGRKKELSPWYIGECLRSPSPKLIAQEYDRDPDATTDKFFPVVLRDKVERETVRPPTLRGRLEEIDGEYKPNFIKDQRGNLVLWLPSNPTTGELITRGRYGIGNDIAHGLGGEFSSNSACVGWNLDTGEQVLEFASTTITPPRFAQWSVALCQLLNKAWLNWEAIGPPGAAFTRAVLGLGYPNIYLEPVNDLEIRHKRGRKAGWHKKDKTVLLGGTEGGGLKEAIIDGRAKIRSQDLVNELGQFIFDEQGNLMHAEEKRTQDLFSRGKAHGDRVIAAGVGWLLVDETPKEDETIKEQRAPEPPRESMGWRERQWEKEQETVESYW